MSSNTQIQFVRTLEILDSRGFPPLRVTVGLEDGTLASASVPSGASTGENEAAELRDGDARRYGGKGVRKALANVNEVIAPRLIGFDATAQARIDRMMCDLDGTTNKAKLGANVILGVSQALARAAAKGAADAAVCVPRGCRRASAAGAHDECAEWRQARRFEPRL